MSAGIATTLTTSGSAQFIDTPNGLAAETPVNTIRKPISARSVVASGYINLPIAAAGSGDIWPDAVSSIAAGDAIVFVLDFYHGTTDTLLAAKAITVTVNAEVLKSWGDPLEFSETSVTTVVVARAAGNEAMYVKGFWYVYTV